MEVKCAAYELWHLVPWKMVVAGSSETLVPIRLVQAVTRLVVSWPWQMSGWCFQGRPQSLHSTSSTIGYPLKLFTIRYYRVFRAQADWTFHFTIGTSTERAAPLAEKVAVARHHVLRSLISLHNEHLMYILKSVKGNGVRLDTPEENRKDQ
jgi:hypothetical protein